MPRKKLRKKRKNNEKKYLLFIVAAVLVISLASIYYAGKNGRVTIISPENKTYSDGHVFISIHSYSELKSLERRIDSNPKVLECTGCFDFQRNDTFFTSGTHSYTIYAVSTSGSQIVKSVIFTVE